MGVRGWCGSRGASNHKHTAFALDTRSRVVGRQFCPWGGQVQACTSLGNWEIPTPTLSRRMSERQDGNYTLRDLPLCLCCMSREE